MKPSAVVASLALSICLSACSVTSLLDPYMVDVRQGNFVSQEMVAQLKPGMTKEQVRFALGTPLVTDIFHGERWDYLYRFKPGRGELQQRHLSVYFDQGKLVRVGGDVVAAGSANTEAAAAPTPTAKMLELGTDGKLHPVNESGVAEPAKPAN